ncbi:MAG: acylneuraminate cytidylyltransferase family protein [Bdellovibrionales bacterium]|nr:acylneuraminate cytidylyltransferase family protein [Bdellovibrionales bacterium]
MKTLGLVVGRGGSKGVPNKNIRNVGGRPLIEWCLMAAKESKLLNKISLSTDSKNIQDAARRFDIDIPFTRPSDLAKDDTLVVDVIKHAVNYYKDQGEIYDYVCLLQPTSPLVTTQQIDSAIQLAHEKSAHTIITVHDAAQTHPTMMFHLNDDKSASWYLEAKDGHMSRRQEKFPIYTRSGLLYVIDVNYLLENNSIYGPKLYALDFPPHHSICIDTEFDIELADFLLRKNKKDLCL